ncbi:MAG: hypothetical protein ACYT04_43410 [Nostoc sp.]
MNPQETSDLLAALMRQEELLKQLVAAINSDGILPWLLANGWKHDDESCLIANIVDESTSLDQVWESDEFDFKALLDKDQEKLHQIFEHFYL